MIKLWPENWDPLKSAAERYVKKGRVADIEFSGETYQVKVLDEQTQADVWVFIQLDKLGTLKDCFCSCQEGGEGNPCVHLAAAFLRITQGGGIPLHIRFENSLWNHLCRSLCDQFGENSLKFQKNQWGNKGICIRPRNKFTEHYLKGTLQERPSPTEETSLKFSNLTEEELNLWRSGNPTPDLRYELSEWSDLAKWLMLLQDEGKKYRLRFLHGSKSLPQALSVLFNDVWVWFSIKPKDWPEIIPSFKTVESPLLVHDQLGEGISEMRYDPKEGALKVESSQIVSHDKIGKGISAGDWVYIPKEGFYPKKAHPLLSSSPFYGEKISTVLDEYAGLISSVLKKTRIHLQPVRLSYAITFDAKCNLYLEGYVFNLGDLADPLSRIFGHWVYLHPQGFYRLGLSQFESIKQKIPEDQVAEFVRQHRTWFNQQEGFHIHLGSIEAQLKFHVSPTGHLSFSRSVLGEKEVKSHDFGFWVYVEGQGFYPKVHAQAGLIIPPGVVLHPEQIPSFIRQYKEDLKLVSGFFLTECPVQRSGIVLILNHHDDIWVAPRFDLASKYLGKEILNFEEFIYLRNEGFYELPPDLRLPDKYQSPHNISGEALVEFLKEDLPKIHPRISEMDPRIYPAEHLRLRVESIEEIVGSDHGKYTFTLSYTTERGNVSLKDIWTAQKAKKKVLFSDAGALLVQEPRFTWISKLEAKQLDDKKGNVVLTTLEFIRLQVFEEVELSKSANNTSLEAWKALTNFSVPFSPNLDGLKSQLRTYQQLGVDWLWFLYHHHLSGLLCDDMGLGKTHQAMGLLAAVTNVNKESKFLVLCPTSVLYHWREKLQMFLPKLKVLVLHGETRHTDVFKTDFDLLLTSYGIWRNSHQELKKLSFAVVIFDEIQIAKSHHSLTHASMLSVQGRMRLGLTGTPIENNLRELKALFDLALPTYMPQESEYLRLFVKPIQREDSPASKALLKRFIRPFVLRRTKDEVLSDLPEKTEELSYCDLSSQQRKLYVEVWTDARSRLIEELVDKAKPIPYIHIFTVLSRFKQICDHPALYLKKTDEYKKFHSGKWDLFIELLQEARESQQKVVVYSQYLGMLDIIEKYLTEHHINFAGIRGATTNRGAQIERFHKDAKCEVFVASLQAAGLGIDLTAASVVIHYDRWWNAARENQATDRVHRIGQTRGVQVFKLITKDTFEERIDALITRKRKLMEDVVSVDDYQIVKRLNREELIELLQLVEI